MFKLQILRPYINFLYALRSVDVDFNKQMIYWINQIRFYSYSFQISDFSSIKLYYINVWQISEHFYL